MIELNLNLYNFIEVNIYNLFVLALNWKMCSEQAFKSFVDLVLALYFPLYLPYCKNMF